jgi:hypothetical protein
MDELVVYELEGTADWRRRKSEDSGITVKAIVLHRASVTTVGDAG